jgi:hypothetical protein
MQDIRAEVDVKNYPGDARTHVTRREYTFFDGREYGRDGWDCVVGEDAAVSSAERKCAKSFWRSTAQDEYTLFRCVCGGDVFRPRYMDYNLEGVCVACGAVDSLHSG